MRFEGVKRDVIVIQLDNVDDFIELGTIQQMYVQQLKDGVMVLPSKSKISIEQYNHNIVVTEDGD